MKTEIVTLYNHANCIECDNPLLGGFAYRFKKGFTHPDCGTKYAEKLTKNPLNYEPIEIQYNDSKLQTIN